MAKLQAVGENIWTASLPLKLMGTDAGTRTTVVRLPNGKLWVHSPGKASEDLVAQVSALGPVGYLVAPNKFHHLYVNQWRRLFPEAQVHVAPGLDAKRPDLAPMTLLGDKADAAWSDVIDQVATMGMPVVNEVVFFHRPSRTLIVTDFIMHMRETAGLWNTLFWSIAGVRGRATRTFFEKLMVRDGAGLRRSLDTILSWDFDRILLAHRDPVETGGKEVIRAAFEGVS